MPIGYQFPFQISTGSVGYFEMTNSVADSVASNLRVLLLTNWGERPMNYNFGCNLREFLFEQSTREDLSQKIADRIIQQVSKWMPNVELTTLYVLLPEDDSSLPPNGLVVKIGFKVIGKNVSGEFDQIVLA